MNGATAAPSSTRASRATVGVYLRPGEYFVGDATHRIRTVLGSCVSVTLWSPQRCVGAMSHFVLASRGIVSSKAPVGRPGLDAKYGDEALELMLHELARLKVDAAECQAKIFGGGDMFPTQKNDGAIAVGRRNGEAARLLLRSHGIEPISESLFGAGHRQIFFDVGSGHVWSRQVAPHTDFAALEP